jgi:hypothetical protein
MFCPNPVIVLIDPCMVNSRMLGLQLFICHAGVNYMIGRQQSSMGGSVRPAFAAAIGH